MPKAVPRDHKLRVTLGAEDDKIVNLVLKRNSQGKIRFPCMDCGSPVDLTSFFRERLTSARLNCSAKSEKHPYTFRWTLG